MVVLVAGCIGSNSTTTTTIAGNAVAAIGDSVAVDYTGMLENGTVFDTSIGNTPLEFVVGAGQMIKGFDDAVIGMKVGEEKTVQLEPDEAYGEYNESLIIDLPKSSVPEDVVEGDILYSSSGIAVSVLAVGDENVTVDFNHPLAGKTLIFNITMLEIMKA
jgi:peptidylprolyl isomerase